MAIAGAVEEIAEARVAAGALEMAVATRAAAGRLEVAVAIREGLEVGTASPRSRP